MTPEPATQPGHLEAIAARMLNQTVITVNPAIGGGNNRIHQVVAKDGMYALKFYPSQDEDPNDRLKREFQALEFMNAHGLSCIPKPVAIDHVLGCGVYEWIDGAPICQPKEDDVKAMVNLTNRLAALQTAHNAKDLAPASAHCFSAAAVVVQLDNRLVRLRDAGKDEDDLIQFLENEFCPILRPFVSRAKNIYANAGIDFDADLWPNHRTLSPSDFGFHNALKRTDGKIVFLDFEYFGWDDPVKMISDAVWHPGSNIPPILRNAFRKQAGKVFQDREGEIFTVRLDALHLLFGMIWVLIILNEFLPGHWHRRVAAGKATDVDQARASQLGIAKNFLKRISDTSHEQP